ncbi:MAG: lipoyl synthase [Ignavibacteriae bacterium]|nr:lipoyl synthase [Ignavibacteriota bacterium]MCB9206671.1 lipoyl synthase [Ignavibacteriales bacterium]MCB9210615.1 lipoyl synthase [Ignavibacteriales bacterium]MCB9218783.1 lipoyl synthase [Ignavibacteriales bacterium]MCB9259213.1 lipoyl synthase [Ignavibacteriales bacterium]
MKLNKHQREYKDSVEQEKIDLGRRPDWLKVRLPSGDNYREVLSMMRKSKLNTVCEEAKCPNLAECWNNRTATYMILGDTCTRTCGFCDVKTGKPTFLDWDEPNRVVQSVLDLGLKHVVITSVNRDELKDGGAAIFSKTVELIREKAPNCTIEILIPDFQGSEVAFEIIMKNPPDILNHNLETVKRLYHAVRPQADYQRSLDLIKWFKNKGLKTKSGIMVGIGEKTEEVLELMQDLKNSNCDIMTIGQYLQPTKTHLPVDRYVTLEEFAQYKNEGKNLGFLAVESGPLVRSSYHAEKHA